MSSALKLAAALGAVALLGAAYWWANSRATGVAPAGSTRLAAVEETTDAARPEGEDSPDAAPAAAPASSLSPATGDRFGTGAGKLAVWVEDPEAVRVAGAEVCLSRSEADVRMARGVALFHREATSTAEEPCVFAELPDGYFALVATKGERGASQLLYLSAQNPGAVHTLVLAQTGSISGYVRDETGAAIAGAAITPARGDAASAHIAPLLASAYRTTSSADGAFRIAHLPVEKWQLLATADGFAPHYSDWLEPGATDVILTLCRGAAVSGRVLLQETGEAPPAGLVVVLSGALPLERHEAKTDGEGRFRFSDVGDAKYRWKVEDETLVLAEEMQHLVVRDGSAAPEALLVVAPGAVAAGRVYDAGTKRGIAGVELQVSSHLRPEDGPVAKAKTAEDGSYRVGPIPPGTWAIRRSHFPGYPMPQWRQAPLFVARLGATMSDLDFELSRGVTIAGRVEDRGGNEIPGAQVRALVEGTNGWQQAITDRAGRFKLLGFAAQDQVLLDAAKAGFAAAPAGALTVPPEGIAEHVLTLEPEASIAGRVVDASGKPLSGISVQVQPPDRGRFPSPPAITDIEGRFRAGGLGAGTYFVNAQRPQRWAWGESTNGKQVTVAAEEAITGLEIVLTEDAAAAIRGTVTGEGGEAVAGAQVNCWSQLGKGAGSVSEEDGAYELAGLMPGNYTVQVVHADFAAQRRPNVARGSAGIDFVLEATGFVAGVVRDARTSNPIAEFEIAQFEGELTALQPWHRDQFTRHSEPAGRFRVRRAAIGPVTVVARARGYTEAALVAGARDGSGGSAGEPETEVVILLEPGSAVEGFVADAGGNPIEGASIFVGPVPDEWVRAQAIAARSDGEGRFEIPSVAAEATELSAYHASFAPATVPLSAARSAPVRFLLRSGASIAGTVTAGGEPRGGCWVSVSCQGSGGGGGHASDENGHFRFDGLPEGAASVNAGFQSEGAIWRNRSLMVELVAGETRTVNFEFLAGTATLEGQVIADGVDLGNATATVAIESEGGSETCARPLSADGTFRFEGLLAGKGSVNITTGSETNRMRQQGAAIELVPGLVLRKEIRFSGGATISGRITGTEGAAKVFAAAHRGEVEIRTLTQEVLSTLETKIAAVMQIGKDGEYILEGLEAGTYTLLVAASDSEILGSGDLARLRLATSIVTVGGEDKMEVDLAVPARE